MCGLEAADLRAVDPKDVGDGRHFQLCLDESFDRFIKRRRDDRPHRVKGFARGLGHFVELQPRRKIVRKIRRRRYQHRNLTQPSSSQSFKITSHLCICH
jgi:hypothetical protein